MAGGVADHEQPLKVGACLVDHGEVDDGGVVVMVAEILSQSIQGRKREF